MPSIRVALMIRSRDPETKKGAVKRAQDVEIPFFLKIVLPSWKQVLDGGMSMWAYLASVHNNSSPSWEWFKSDKTQTLAFHGGNLPINVLLSAENTTPVFVTLTPLTLISSGRWILPILGLTLLRTISTTMTFSTDFNFLSGNGLETEGAVSIFWKVGRWRRRHYGRNSLVTKVQLA